jgi:elongation of very long chain fatty acids protein 7
MDSYPLMGSPFPTIFIIALFLLFVLYIGPMMMEKRKPLDIKNIMIVYNVYQVFFSAILVIVVRILEVMSI